MAIVAVLLFTAVGAYAFLPGSASTAPGSPSALSPYDQLRAQVGPNGEISKEIALEAFSLAVAPLPGVTVPTGAPPNVDQQADATFAVMWIMRYLDQLTPDQRAVVDSVMSVDPAAPTIPPQAGALKLLAPRLPQVVLAADTPASEYLDLVEMYEQQIASELGRQLSMTLSLELDKVQTNGKGVDWLAYSVPVGEDHGVCALHVEPLLQNLNKLATRNATMAHEVFHCFQFDWARQHGVSLATVPDWIVEGQAEWAGESLGGPSLTGAEWWLDYLVNPQKALFGRDYDAVGFYQHMAEEGTNPWTHFDNMWAGYKQDTNVGAYDGADAQADTFLDTWASGIFKDAKLGAEWDAKGPWQVTADPPKDPLTINNGQTKSASASEVTNDLVIANVNADILEVQSTGHVRMNAPPVPQLPATDRWLCYDPNQCKCPPGKTYQGPDLEYVTPNPDGATAEFGVTGGLLGATLTLTGHDLDEFCKPMPSQGTPAPPCQSNCGHSNGDPHLRTINRYAYDFQAAGEFTLLRNADSGPEIQARQEPYTGSRVFRGVSINTAIAALDNGHRVGVYVTDGGLSVRVDGQPIDPNAPPDLGAGAAIRPISGGFEIDFPDGSALSALSLGQWGINAVVQASSDLLSSGEGLLGPISPGGMGVPALPDGTQLPPAPDFETRHATLYGQFADAWRVTDQTTLFDYDPGKTTASYTDRNFPSDADDAALAGALASPDPTQQAAAESACAGLTDADLAADCVFDVYATGDAGFAQQYQATQDLYDSGIVPATLPPPSPTGATGVLKIVDLQDLDGSAIGPDDTLYVSITDSSGQPLLLAIDPTSAAIKQQVPLRVATDIHFAAGSVWIAGEVSDAGGSYCTVSRYDPQTLADQGDYPTPCTFGGPSAIVSMGDAVWFIDQSKVDPNTGAGAALTRIDPATNAPSKSVALPQSAGCCQGSDGAIFCYCGNSAEWRLTNDDSTFVELGGYTQIYPAASGFWTEQGNSAVYVDGPSGPSASVPLGNGRVVGGDPTGVYIQGANEQLGTPDNQLSRQPADGSPPVVLATPPTTGSGVDQTFFDYLSGAFPWFATPRGYLHLWVFKELPDSPLALWQQWAPLP